MPDKVVFLLQQFSVNMAINSLSLAVFEFKQSNFYTALPDIATHQVRQEDWIRISTMKDLRNMHGKIILISK